MNLDNNWFRPAACYLVEVMKRNKSEVADFFGVERHRVYDAVKRYNETGGHKNRKGQGRKRTSRDEAHIKEAQNHLNQNSHTKKKNGVTGNSKRKLAKKLQISPTSAYEILTKDLKLKAWKKTKGQKLNVKQKINRLKRAKALKTRFGNGGHRRILFTDEKFFTIEEGHNHQNDRIWSSSKPSKEVRVVQHQMKPKGVMVWCGVGYDTKAPLIFVKAGIKIDTDVYRKEILEPVEDWAMDHYGTTEEVYWNDWCFQQDSAPSHASVHENEDKFEIPTQKWLSEHFPDFITKNEWPASSPDLNPLDYACWSILEAEVNAESHQSVESLKQAIIDSFKNMDQKIINKSIDDWMNRLDKVISANGGHFE